MSDVNREVEEGRILNLNEDSIRIQNRMFTKWLNYQLRDTEIKVTNIFKDLADGKVLLELMEVLSDGDLGRPNRGNMRVHKIENVSRVLNFIQTKTYLGNIGAEDIVDRIPRLILSLIWNIISRFQIQEMTFESDFEAVAKKSPKDALLLWCQKVTNGYKNVDMKDFSKSWRDGVAFNALIHAHRPELIKFDEIDPSQNKTNLITAFNLAQSEFDVPNLLDAMDIDIEIPDYKCVLTYVSLLYITFNKPKDVKKRIKRPKKTTNRRNLTSIIVFRHDQYIPKESRVSLALKNDEKIENIAPTNNIQETKDGCHITDIDNVVLTTAETVKIDKKLTEIKEYSDWSQFDLGISLDNIDLTKLIYSDIVEKTKILENIAKLSINLFNDFDYYRHFLFESQFDSPLYLTLLKDLGYVCHEGIWRCTQRPDKSIVHKNIFSFCLHRLAQKEMMSTLNDTKKEYTEISDVGHETIGASSTNEEVPNDRLNEIPATQQVLEEVPKNITCNSEHEDEISPLNVNLKCPEIVPQQNNKLEEYAADNILACDNNKETSVTTTTSKDEPNECNNISKIVMPRRKRFQKSEEGPKKDIEREKRYSCINLKYTDTTLQSKNKMEECSPVNTRVCDIIEEHSNGSNISKVVLPRRKMLQKSEDVPKKDIEIEKRYSCVNFEYTDTTLKNINEMEEFAPVNNPVGGIIEEFNNRNDISKVVMPMRKMLKKSEEEINYKNRPESILDNAPDDRNEDVASDRITEIKTDHKRSIKIRTLPSKISNYDNEMNSSSRTLEGTDTTVKHGPNDADQVNIGEILNIDNNNEDIGQESYKWRCSMCECTNVCDGLTCEICYETHNNDDWICSNMQCKMINERKDDTCARCTPAN